MTDKQNLLAGLATTLEIEPDQILLYKATSSTFAPGYTVILTDYRKFTGVIPDYQIEEPDEENMVTVNGIELPAELVVIYNNPKDYNRADLRELGAYLKIPKARTLNKAPLISKINAFKLSVQRREFRTNQATPEIPSEEPLSIEQADKELFD